MSENLSVEIDGATLDALERIHETLARIANALERPTPAPRPGPCHQAAPPGVGIERGHRCENDWGHLGAHVAEGRIEKVTWMTSIERDEQEAAR
jgi:hypothetical protein